MRGTTLPILLDGRGFDDGKSSKKPPVPGFAFNAEGGTRPTEVVDPGLGRLGMAGYGSWGGSAPEYMLVLLGGGGWLLGDWVSGLGRVEGNCARFLGRLTSIGRSYGDVYPPFDLSAKLWADCGIDGRDNVELLSVGMLYGVAPTKPFGADGELDNPVEARIG